MTQQRTKKNASKPTPKPRNSGTRVPPQTKSRDGSKSAAVLDLLKRKDGASMDELLKVTGWQAHSVRGFLAGTVTKKTGAKVTSAKGEDGVRRYLIE